MTEEEFQQIRERLDYFRAVDAPFAPRADVRVLLAEVERLRAALANEQEARTQEYEYANAEAETAARRIRQLIAQNAAMREIVQVVANGVEWPNYNEDCRCCSWCPAETTTAEEVPHTPDCPVTKARAILATESE